MVHALEEIHRQLKPTGVLIDMHPVAESLPIEIHQGGKIDLAGYVTVRQWCIDFQQADNALAEIVQRGVFAVEREDIFDSFTYYDSVTEMLTELGESVDKFARDAESAGEAIPDAEALGARAEELMQAAGLKAKLIAHERIHISRLRPT